MTQLYNHNMRDVVLIYPTDTSDTSWNLDLDIIDGYPRYVSEENNTEDQRAAVAALIAKGSVPGNPNLGIDWSQAMGDNNSFLLIDNQIKQQIASLAAIGSEEQQVQYIPVFKKDENGGVGVQVYRA